MVQRFHHPLMVFNCDDTPSSPDGISLNGVSNSHGISNMLHVNKPYKIPNLGVLGLGNVVAAIDWKLHHTLGWYFFDWHSREKCDGPPPTS